MIENKKVLIVTQEMDPYVVISEMAKVARQLPKYLQDEGYEIRVLMPRFGTVNERRHRLHEVVRLSGINIIIGEDDYPLIIKVASLPGARMQVYFLDNEDFFKRKGIFGNKENQFFDDNAERMIFFCKGVIETVKKFGWAPDIINLHGWMTSLIPLYIKTAYKNEPVFSNSKIVYSLYKEEFKGAICADFIEKAPLIKKSVDIADLGSYLNGTKLGLDLGAMSYSDALIQGSEELDTELEAEISKTDKPVLSYQGTEDFLETYMNFFEELIGIEEEASVN